MSIESTISSSERPRILLVDDNEAILARASAVLSPACLVVGRATDGPSALEAAALLGPDVIVLDISMPRMTGFEVAARLRQAGSKAALVFLTVHADEYFVLAAKEAGVIAYVVKSRLATDLEFAVQEARAGRGFVSALR